MNSATQPNKRMVSRSRYAVTKTLALSLSGGLLFCGVGMLLLLACLLYAPHLDAELNASMLATGERYTGTSLLTTTAMLCAVLIPVLLGTALLLWRGSRSSWKTVRTMQPINYANTANLPAPTSLVRASQEPAQAQEGILLRAVAEGQEKYEEQLLRASAGRHE